jgi:hypothetical protein
VLTEHEHRFQHYLVVQLGVLYPEKTSTVYTDEKHWPGMIREGWECRCGEELDHAPTPV